MIPAGVPPKATTAPRYLFRRVLALYVDALLASLVAFALTAPLVSLLGTDSIRLGYGVFREQTCDQSWISSAQIRTVVGTQPRQVQSCRTRILGVDNGRTAEMVLSGRSGFVNWWTTASLPVSDGGTPVGPGYPDRPLWIAMMVVASAAFHAAGRRTPGKAIVGLSVGGLAGRADALRREGLRWMPVLVLTLMGSSIDLLSATLGRPVFPPPALSTFFMLGLIPFLLWYYVLPFFSLDRDYRARWDKVVGSRVERTRG